jgi:hypothetical protein
VSECSAVACDRSRATRKEQKNIFLKTCERVVWLISIHKNSNKNIPKLVLLRASSSAAASVVVSMNSINFGSALTRQILTHQQRPNPHTPQGRAVSAIADASLMAAAAIKT